jgi:hypothetical protein
VSLDTFRGSVWVFHHWMQQVADDLEAGRGHIRPARIIWAAPDRKLHATRIDRRGVLLALAPARDRDGTTD